MTQLTEKKITRIGKTESRKNIKIRVRLLAPCQFLFVVEGGHAFVEPQDALDIARFIIEHAEEQGEYSACGVCEGRGQIATMSPEENPECPACGGKGHVEEQDDGEK